MEGPYYISKKRTVELTEEQCQTVVRACSFAISKMREYMEEYKRKEATECVFKCIDEINGFERIRKIFLGVGK